MAEAAEENQDQSMEEILQSIKRIIADEDEDDNAPEAQSNGHGRVLEEAKASSDESGSEVLELTELVQDDGTVTDMADAISEPVADSAVLEKAPEPEPAPVAAAPAKAPSPDEGLISNEAAMASASALNSLKSAKAPEPKQIPKIDSPSFRSGATVEDLVLEALKPMLKDWLDTNLQQIVERMVEQEIRRISE